MIECRKPTAAGREWTKRREFRDALIAVWRKSKKDGDDDFDALNNLRIYTGMILAGEPREVLLEMSENGELHAFVHANLDEINCILQRVFPPDLSRPLMRGGRC